MRSFRALLSGIGSILFSLGILAPIASILMPTPHEIWISQAMHETQWFHLIPLLNGHPLHNQNPLDILLLSLLSAGIMKSRSLMIILGGLLSLCVFLYSKKLWGVRAGALSVFFTASSLGFLEAFGLLNTAALPCTLVIIAFLIFSSAYLKEKKGVWFTVSYLLLCLATLTGGLVMLLFFVISVMLLILLDLSPQRFLDIRPVSGLGIMVIALLCFYLVYRIAGGPFYVGDALSPGEDMGLFESLWVFMKYTLPWLPLIIPAWMYTARPDDGNVWRDLLPVKIAFLMGFALLWLSGRCVSGYAILSVPFGAMLIGYWTAREMRSTPRLEPVRLGSMILVALAVLVITVVYLVRGPVKIMEMGLPQALSLCSLLLFVIATFLLIRKRIYMRAVILCILIVFAWSWYQSFFVLNRNGPLSYISTISRYQPLLVFEDDLVMRGYMGYVGKKPVIVGREFVPIVTDAYLAATTSNLGHLLKGFNGHMIATPVSSVKFDTTYALIKVSPARP